MTHFEFVVQHGASLFWLLWYTQPPTEIYDNVQIG